MTDTGPIDGVGDDDARVRAVVLAANTGQGGPIPEPAATAAQLRARAGQLRRRRRPWSLLWQVGRVLDAGRQMCAR